MRCRSCGAEVAKGLRICPACGAPVRRFPLLRGTVRCAGCEAAVPAHLTVCPHCGADLRHGWRPILRVAAILVAVGALAYGAWAWVPWQALADLPGRMDLPQVSFLVTPTFTRGPTFTPTVTRTREPTATRTATAVPPTETATPPPPTATEFVPPTATPTATPRFAPVVLSRPEDGEQYVGGGSVIQLVWEAAGALAEDEWYALSLRYSTDGAEHYSGTWTKETSWTVPEELFMRAGQNERTFAWDVTIMRQTGTSEDGGRSGTPVNEASETRTFVWQ